MSRNGNSEHRSRLAVLLQRLRRLLVGTAAALIIATAVLVGIGRLLVPHADVMRPWLEAQLSERLGREIAIERVEARWPRLTPTITLRNVRAGDPDAPLAQIGRAILETRLPDLFSRARAPFRLVVLDLDLIVAEDENGQWGLRLERGGALADRSGGLSGPDGELLVRDARLSVRPRQREAIDLVVSEGVIRRQGQVTELLAELRPSGNGQARLSLAARARHAEGGVSEIAGRVETRDLALARLALGQGLAEELQVPADRLDADLSFAWGRRSHAWMDLEFAVRGEDDFEASGALRAERSGRRVDARLLALDHAGETVLRDAVVAQESGLWAVDLPDLELARVHRLLGRWFGRWEHWPTRLSGRVRDLSGLYRHPGSFHRLAGRVDDFAFALPDGRVAISDLRAELGVAGDRASLALSGSPVIAWPKKMRQPIPIDAISGRVNIAAGAVELAGIVGRRPEARARADGWVWLGGGRPFLDFGITGELFERVDPRPWLPAGQIPPRALEWLDRALLGVGSASGELNYHFRLGHKFRAWNPGDFQAEFDFNGANMDFWPDWPEATAMRGRVAFVGRGLSGQVRQGRLGSVDVRAEQVDIPDLTRPVLSLNLVGEAVGAEPLRGLLADFPLEAWPRFLAPLLGLGELDLETRLVLPFRDMPSWQLSGRANLAGTGIALPAAGIEFTGLAGEVAFDRSGIEPAELRLDDSANGRLRLEAGFGDAAWLALDGHLSPSAIVAADAPWRSMARRLHGATDWQVRLRGREAGSGWRLELASDLEGLAIDLPSPLSKSAETALDLNVTASHGPEAASVSASLGERFALEGRNDSGQWRFGLGLDRAAPQIPEEEAFAVSGSLDRLDLTAWRDVLPDGTARPAERAPAGRVALSVGQLAWGDLSLDAVEVDLRRRDGDWRMALRGDSISGEVVIPVPLDSGRVLAIDLQHLHLEEVIGVQVPETLEEAPVAAQIRTQVPLGAPPLHLLIEELSYRGMPLGRVRMESHSRSDGIEIERIEVEGPNLDLSGYGRWIARDDGPVTEFEGRLTTTRLEPLLQSFGYETGLSAARAQIDLSGSWPGSPGDFSLARLNGLLDLGMFDGSIPEARPGAGRLIGLVSISTVPRRLMLDFRDVFSEGLSFDSIEGRFELAEGVARTDRLRVDSPAADIELSGVTDLGARSYDQLVVVEPAVSNTLPVIGGLAGGPLGAAAGLVLRTVLERPLQGIAEARYRITGSWDDPQVELIGTRAAEVPPPEESEPDPD